MPGTTTPNTIGTGRTGEHPEHGRQDRPCADDNPDEQHHEDGPGERASSCARGGVSLPEAGGGDRALLIGPHAVPRLGEVLVVAAERDLVVVGEQVRQHGGFARGGRPRTARRAAGPPCRRRHARWPGRLWPRARRTTHRRSRRRSVRAAARRPATGRRPSVGRTRSLPGRPARRRRRVARLVRAALG